MIFHYFVSFKKFFMHVYYPIEKQEKYLGYENGKYLEIDKAKYFQVHYFVL